MKIIIIWYLFLIRNPVMGMIKSICQENSRLNIFAADSLLNSTLRLYSLHYNYDLILFTKTASDKLPVFLESSNGTKLYGFLKPAKQTAFNVSVIDTQKSARTVVTVSDSLNREMTTLFSTENGNGYYWTWKTHENILENYGHIQDIFISSNGSAPVIINAAFRAYIKREQFMFMILRGEKLAYMKLQVDSFNADNTTQTIHPVDIDKETYHQGSIPAGLTAAFVVHVSLTENFLVFFRCNQYCSVLFYNFKWNFNTCKKSTNWRNLSIFLKPEEPIGERLLPLAYVTQEPEDNIDKIFVALGNGMNSVSNLCYTAKSRIKNFFRKYPIMAWLIPIALLGQFFYCCWIFGIARNKRGGYLINEVETESNIVI